MIDQINNTSKLVEDDNDRIGKDGLLALEDKSELNFENTCEDKNVTENNKSILEEDHIIDESLSLQNNFSEKEDHINQKSKQRKKKISHLEYIEDRKYSEKSWGATLIFCIFLGLIGFHRFYVGKAGTAILMLFTLGGFGIWTLVDLIIIILNSFTDEEGRTIKRKKLSEQH